MAEKLVAVTGGTGFLGCRLIPLLVQKGYRVRLLQRAGSAHPLLKLPMPSVEETTVNFSDADNLRQVCAGADAVIHGIGLVSYDRKDQSRMHEVNVELTRRMLKAAKAAGVPRFLHVSSIVTLGYGPEPRDERAPYNAKPLGLAYWDTKTEAERLALSFNSPEFTVLAVNPGSLVGPGEKADQLTPFVRKLATQRRPLLPGGGSDFVDAEDVALGTWQALERGRAGQRYILGAYNLSYPEFHAELRRALGKDSKPIILPHGLLWLAEKLLLVFERLTRIDLPVNSARIRRVNGISMFHDCSLARRELGYEPRPLANALRGMVGAGSEK